MMKQIISLRVAAVALAASALITLPATADVIGQAAEKAAEEARRNAEDGHDEHRRRDDDDWRRDDRRDDGYYGDHRRTNRFGQTFREAERLRRDAVNACSYEVDRVSYRGRFQQVSYDDRRRIDQYNRHGVTVRFDDVEFRTRYGSEDRSITCVYDRGEVVRLDGLPGRDRPGRGRGW